MDTYKQSPIRDFESFVERFILLKGSKILVIVVIIGLVIGFFPVFGAPKEQNKISALTEEEILEELEGKLITLQDNSLAPIRDHFTPSVNKTIGKIRVIVTAYSSSVWETDNDPFITASGSTVRNGIIANNYLAFGTKVKIPALYGDQVFMVTDRMNSRMPNNKIDIWFPSYSEAKNFGVKNTYIEILES